MPISAVYPSGRLVPPRVRALLVLLQGLAREGGSAAPAVHRRQQTKHPAHTR
jgi:hypothetical protein